MPGSDIKEDTSVVCTSGENTLYVVVPSFSALILDRGYGHLKPDEVRNGIRLLGYT